MRLTPCGILKPGIIKCSYKPLVILREGYLLGPYLALTSIITSREAIRLFVVETSDERRSILLANRLQKITSADYCLLTQ